MILTPGVKVIKNPNAWCESEFDTWGRGEGIGVILQPPFPLGPEIVDVRWPAGRCLEHVFGLTAIDGPTSPDP